MTVTERLQAIIDEQSGIIDDLTEKLETVQKEKHLLKYQIRQLEDELEKVREIK